MGSSGTLEVIIFKMKNEFRRLRRGGGAKNPGTAECQQHLDPRTQTIFELSFEATCLILDGSPAFSLSCFGSIPTT